MAGDMLQRNPSIIVLISGKRKSGKDYVATLLQQKLLHAFETNSPNNTPAGVLLKAAHRDAVESGVEVHIFHIAEPIKREWAQRHQLDLAQLMDSSSVKEKYRRDMVAWGNEQREKDPDIFCRLATEPLLDSSASNSLEALPIVWILADARQETDVYHFIRRFSRERCITVRVVADEATRKTRGWQFVDGIDDAVTECGLDALTDWDIVVCNNNECFSQGDVKTVDAQVELIVARTLASMKPKQQ